MMNPLGTKKMIDAVNKLTSWESPKNLKNTLEMLFTNWIVTEEDYTLETKETTAFHYKLLKELLSSIEEKQNLTPSKN